MRSNPINVPRSTSIPTSSSSRPTPSWCTPTPVSSRSTRSTHSSAKRFLITVRPDDHVDLGPVLERWDRSPELVSLGVGYLLYCLLDQVLDSYFDAIETFDDFYEKVSDSLFEDTPINPMKQREWFEMRRSLVRLHRLTFNLREAVNGLLRREHDGGRRPIAPVLPGRLRPRDPGRRVDRRAPGPGVDHRRHQPEPSRLPPEPGGQEGDELGRHHRRARPSSPGSTG